MARPMRTPQVTRDAARGFTLIEVVIALAAFALCAAAIYEALAGAMRRSAQARDRELAGLIAQSVLDAQRVQPFPWRSARSGRSAGFDWHLTLAPHEAPVAEDSAWRAYVLSIRVQRSGSTGRAVTLESIELARSAP